MGAAIGLTAGLAAFGALRVLVLGPLPTLDEPLSLAPPSVPGDAREGTTSPDAASPPRQELTLEAPTTAVTESDWPGVDLPTRRLRPPAHSRDVSNRGARRIEGTHRSLIDRTVPVLPPPGEDISWALQVQMFPDAEPELECDPAKVVWRDGDDNEFAAPMTALSTAPAGSTTLVTYAATVARDDPSLTGVDRMLSYWFECCHQSPEGQVCSPALGRPRVPIVLFR